MSLSMSMRTHRHECEHQAKTSDGVTVGLTTIATVEDRFSTEATLGSKVKDRFTARA